MKYLFIVVFMSFVCLHQAQTKPAAKQKPKAAPIEEKVEGPDRKASYPGGEKAMASYILSNLKYPAELDNYTSIKTHKVFLKFMIDKTGKVANAHVVKGIKGCKSCTDEALRVINAMLLWTPAVIENKRVDSWHSLPITFIKK